MHRPRLGILGLRCAKRSSASMEEIKPSVERREHLFNAQQKDVKLRGCVYCEHTGHKATQCDKVVETRERKKNLAEKGSCYNCATRKHRASECSSKTLCQYCKRRHHSSICEQRDQASGSNKRLLTDGATREGICLVILVKVNGVICRALIDSGAGGSYASAKLIQVIDKSPSEMKFQRIDMLMG